MAPLRPQEEEESCCACTLAENHIQQDFIEGRALVRVSRSRLLHRAAGCPAVPLCANSYGINVGCWLRRSCGAVLPQAGVCHGDALWEMIRCKLGYSVSSFHHCCSIIGTCPSATAVADSGKWATFCLVWKKIQALVWPQECSSCKGWVKHTHQAWIHDHISQVPLCLYYNGKI